MDPVVLAVTGASAMPLAERGLQLLLEAGETVELVASRGALGVWLAEQGVRIPAEPDLQARFWRDRTGVATGQLRCHRWNDQAAAIASGSFRTRGMVILPASMGTVGRIASGVALDLVERVADVHLKEGRPLVISPGKCPGAWFTCATSRPWRRRVHASLHRFPPGITAPPPWRRWSTFW